MKKTTIFCILAVLVLAIFACKPPVEEEVPPVVPEVEEAPEEAPEVEEAPPTPIELISAARCIDDKIEATIANTGTETAEIAKNLKILLRGMTVSDPDCDETILEPGESTFCANIAGHFPLAEGNNRVLVRLADQELEVTVVCGE